MDINVILKDSRRGSKDRLLRFIFVTCIAGIGWEIIELKHRIRNLEKKED